MVWSAFAEQWPKSCLRAHSWRTSGGEVRTAYYYDMRGTGQSDIALGTDYPAAIVAWERIKSNAPRIAGTLEEAFQRWERECLLTYRRTTSALSSANASAKIHTP